MFHFTLSSPAVSAVLLLTLVTIAIVTPEDREAIFQNLGSSYSYSSIGSSSVNTSNPTRGAAHCAYVALNSDSEFFSYNKISQLCTIYAPNAKLTLISGQASNEMPYYKRSPYNPWLKVYALSHKAGSNVYDSFVNIGSPEDWNVDNCNGTFCPNFFRHPILDIWNALPIDEVKLVLYENETAVVNMVFDGRNSSIRNWFTIERLKSSPWNDLVSNNVKNFVFKRRGNNIFKVGTYRLCSNSRGWFRVLQKRGRCSFTQVQHYPVFAYSNSDSEIFWNNEHGEADTLNILIRLRPN